MSEEAYKRKRVELTLAVKSEICKYSIQNRNLKQKEIREHFNQKFSTEIGKSTLSDILRDRHLYANIDNLEILNQKRISYIDRRTITSGEQMTGLTGPRKARNTINLEQKKAIVLYHDAHPYLTQKELADHFSAVFNLKIACSTLSEILKSRKRLFAQTFGKGSLDRRFRMRSKKQSSAAENTTENTTESPENTLPSVDASSSSAPDEEASNATITDSIYADLHSVDSSTKPAHSPPGISSSSSLNECKRVRTGWTLEQKRQIVLFCENNSHRYTQKGLADHFSAVFNKRIGRSTINEILKVKDKLFSDEVACHPQARRLTEPQYPFLERCLVNWANEQVQEGVPLTDKMLIQAAKKFGENDSVGVKANFKYSNSWLQRFKERNNLTNSLSSIHTFNIRSVLNTQASSVDVNRFVNDAKSAARCGQEVFNSDDNLSLMNEGGDEREEEEGEIEDEVEEVGEIVTLNAFRESIRKVELFLRQSDFLFDADDIQLFAKFKSRLDLIQ